MFFEIEMLPDYILSLVNLTEGIDNKENITIAAGNALSLEFENDEFDVQKGV